MELEKAERIAKEWLSANSEYFKRAAIVGSIRRQEKEVKDIDILAIPKSNSRIDWSVAKFKWKNHPINVFLTTEQGWGAGLVWRTGPAGSNIGLCVHYAIPRGLRLNVNGVFDRRTNAYKGGRTEEEVAKLLGWKWKSPELRGH